MKAETPASASIKRGQIQAKTNKQQQQQQKTQKTTFLNAPQSDFDSATDFW